MGSRIFAGGTTGSGADEGVARNSIAVFMVCTNNFLLRRLASMNRLLKSGDCYGKSWLRDHTLLSDFFMIRRAGTSSIYSINPADRIKWRSASHMPVKAINTWLYTMQSCRSPFDEAFRFKLHRLPILPGHLLFQSVARFPRLTALR